MNLDLIPCEMCSQSFPPEQYNIHITICAPNHLHNEFNQTFNTNHNNNHNNKNNSNSNHNHNHNHIPSIDSIPSFDTIPCDKCSQQIPLNEYESHLLMHSLSSSTTTTNKNTSSSSNIPPSIHPFDIDTYSSSTTLNTIPCDKCNQQIPADQYETHQFLHLDDTNNANNNNHHNDNLMMIECKYSDCSTKWIPKNEYNDHLTLHQLQSQQNIPNTSNDELIAFNHQTQLIQQQTATTNPTTNTPDPRRICLSPSFSHLHDTQQPVIPLHDALTPYIHSTNNLFSAGHHSDDIPLRDGHCVNGMIEAIDYVLSTRHHIEYYLCDPLQFYYRDKEDYSWGCGFRNCQTLSSCLILKKNPLDVNGRECGIYSHCLFNGIGYVPQIEQIQRYLDYAHAQGFDPEGLKELGQTEGRRVWIGAVDVAAILRSFYIPAAIFDFQLQRTGNGGQSEEVYHDDLYDWVWQYFQQRYNYHGINGNHHGQHGNQGNNGGQTLISSYFQTQNDDEDGKKKGKGKEEEYGTFSDEDMMLQKALEMSKKQMMEENEMKNTKRKKKGRKNGKMEMDEDSDSGSSFSDDENVLFNSNLSNKNKMEQHDEEEEEKKSDENEEDLFYWDQDNENLIKSDWKQPKQTKVSHYEWEQKKKKQKMMNQDNKDKKKRKGGINNGGYHKRFIPPLYFQHQGHSRTIIGIMRNRRSGITHLLVLDPSIKKGAVNLLNNIKNGNINSLLRSKKQTKAAKYQIVAIPAYGIMTNNDRNRCKTIQSMDVTLMNRIKNNNNNRNNTSSSTR